MQTTDIINDGTSQVVLIPDEFKMQGNQVEIKKIGNSLVLHPRTDSWSKSLASLEEFSADFMADGLNQPHQQKRDGLFD